MVLAQEEPGWIGEQISVPNRPTGTWDVRTSGRPAFKTVGKVDDVVTGAAERADHLGGKNRVRSLSNTLKLFHRIQGKLL